MAQLLIDFPRANESYMETGRPPDVLSRPTFQFRDGPGPDGVWERASNGNGSWCSTRAVERNLYGWFPVTTSTNGTRLRFASNITYTSGDSLNVLIDGLVSVSINSGRVAVLASRQPFRPGDRYAHVQLRDSWTLAMCAFNVTAGDDPPQTFTVVADFVGGGSLQDFNVTITWAKRNCTFVGWQNATLTSAPINRSNTLPFRLHAQYGCLFCINSLTLMEAPNLVAATTTTSTEPRSSATLATETSTSTDPRSPVPSALETSPTTVVGTQSAEPTTPSGAVVPVPDTSSSSTFPSDSPPNVALIAGLSALGAVVLLGLLGAAFLLLRRRNQKQAEAASASTTSSSAQYGSVLTVLH